MESTQPKTQSQVLLLYFPYHSFHTTLSRNGRPLSQTSLHWQVIPLFANLVKESSLICYILCLWIFSSAHVFPSTHKFSCFRLVIVHVHVGLGYSGAELITRPRLVLNVQSSSLIPPSYSRTGSATSWHHHQQRTSKMAPMAHIPPRKRPLSPA